MRLLQGDLSLFVLSNVAVIDDDGLHAGFSHQISHDVLDPAPAAIVVQETQLPGDRRAVLLKRLAQGPLAQGHVLRMHPLKGGPTDQIIGFVTKHAGRVGTVIDGDALGGHQRNGSALFSMRARKRFSLARSAASARRCSVMSLTTTMRAARLPKSRS